MDSVIDISEGDWADACHHRGVFVCISSQTGHGKSTTLRRITGDSLATKSSNSVTIGELRYWRDFQDGFDSLENVTDGCCRAFTTICASSAIDALKVLWARIEHPIFWVKISPFSLVAHQRLVNGIDPFQSSSLKEALERGDPGVKEIAERMSRVAGARGLPQVRFTNVANPVVDCPDHGLGYGMIKMSGSGRLKLILREAVVINDEMKTLLSRSDWPAVLSCIDRSNFQSLRENALYHVLRGRLDPFEFESIFGAFDRYLDNGLEDPFDYEFHATYR